jgi:FAD synthase
MSKRGNLSDSNKNLPKKPEQNRDDVCTMGHCFQGPCQGHLHIVKRKSELCLMKNKIGMIMAIRVHPIGYWDKNYSFQNQLEFCPKVLLLWRYGVKDIQKCPFFIFIFWCFSQ